MAAFRYGLFLNPQQNDPKVSDRDIAEREAKALSVANNGTPVAVWDENDRTLALFAGFEEFKPI